MHNRKYSVTVLQDQCPGLAWLAPVAAWHVTIQARCLRPAARDRSIMWELAYTGPGCVIYNRKKTVGVGREGERISTITLLWVV